MNQSRRWICCQLGAREHYAIPRALHQSNQLECLITDAWVRPDSLFKQLPIKSFKNLGDRHHSDLAEATVHAFTSQLSFFEAKQRLLKTQAWNRMINRNHWFQKQVIHTLKKLPFSKTQSQPILFAYSYAALDILRYAKSQGWITILGQIDPGIEEEKIVIKEYQRYSYLAPDWHPAPAEYWRNWQQECELTDYILVNSDWSKQLLIKSGINFNKIHVVPLVYQPPKEAENFQRIYPKEFSKERPLRVLFLGLVTLRKGIAACLEAMSKLDGLPIEFWFVGSQHISIPEYWKNHPQIKWIGSVPRSKTNKFYQKADVFLFPTLSDGFGLTQLEAQAWKLPIITSRSCGEVVVDGVNGWVLDTVSGEAIARQLKSIWEYPESLANLAEISLSQTAKKYQQSHLSSFLKSISNSY